MAGRFLKSSLNLITSFNAECLGKAASTVFERQAMQAPTVHLPTIAGRLKNKNISAHSKGNGNPETPNSPIVSQETKRAKH